MIYVSSDWHGVPPDTILTLLDRAGFGEEDFLFVLGDVIDRGKHGVLLLRWLMEQPNAELILGNHEAMMLSCEFLFREITDESIDALDSADLALYRQWVSNGAEPTVRALASETPESRADILDYLREAPLYEAVTVEGRDYLLVHGGLDGYEPGRRMRDYDAHTLLWSRPALGDRYSEDFVTILGHTPTGFYGREFAGRMLRTPTWCNIDTGAAGGGTPMLLRLDDGAEFYWN